MREFAEWSLLELRPGVRMHHAGEIRIERSNNTRFEDKTSLIFAGC